MSGGGSKAPQGYQPTGQPQADQNYQNLVSGAMPWAQGLPQSVIPGLQGVVSAAQNNPYYAQAQAGAGAAADMGAQTAGYQQNAGLGLYGAGTSAGAFGSNLANSAAGVGASYAPGLQNLANSSAGTGAAYSPYFQNLAGNSAQVGNQAQLTSQNAINAGQKVNAAGQLGNAETQSLIPSTTQGANYAPGQLNMADMLAQLTAGGALSAIPGLTGGMGAASSVLNTAFDPQGALYGRTLQQVTDQQNAINSMSGVAQSPYGAGLAGDANRNFNIDWQNQQLQRQIAGLGAYGQEQGQVTNDLTSLLGSAAGNYANLTNAGVGQYTNLTSNAVNNLDNLVNTGMSALSTGNSAYDAGMNTYLAGANTNIAGNNSAANSLNAAGSLNLAGNNAAANTLNTAGNLNLSSLGTAGNLNAQGLGAMGAAYGQGSQLGIDALQTGLASSLAPSQTYLGNQNAIQNALLAEASGGAQSLGPTQALIGDEGQYLNIGQGATSLAQNATKINNEQANAQAAGIGNLVGTVAAVALAPATGGLSLFALGGQAGAAGTKAYGGG